MAQPQLLQIKLSRFDAQPWGFRLQGGVDFAAPLLVQKVNGGSLAEQAGLVPGDAVIKINDIDVFNLRHKDAQDIVVRSGNNFVVTVQRGGSTWRPHVVPTGQLPQPNSPYLQTVTKTSLAHKQHDSQHIGCGYNNSARPFGNGVDGNVKSIVNKQYNSPVGIYSDESIAETLSAQAEVLAGGVLGVNFKKNEKEYQAEKSEVLKFLREEESGHSTPEPQSASNYYWTRSHAIGHHKHTGDDERIGTPLQQNTLAPDATHRPSLPTPNEPPQPDVAPLTEIPDPRLIVMPVCPALQTPEYKQELEAAAEAAALGPDGQPRPLSASGHPPCAMCGVGIVGVFVRIKDRNLHVECFKCATCGTSLKNQGYYNFNNKLYCDIHAKLAALQNPPSGTEGYVPVPIKPNTKLSANTITAALNAHGYNNIPTNGSSNQAPQEEIMNDLPLPPPPSPTQLQQYEICNNNSINNNNDSQHTRTLSSLSSMSTGSNTTHSSTQSLSPTPYSYHHNNTIMQQQQQLQQQNQQHQHHQQPHQMTHFQPHNESANSSLSLDQYGSISPLHSRQASSSSSSLNYGCNNDNYGITATIPPPPPPPLPLPGDNNQDLYINTMKQQHNVNNRKLLMTKQNENDMNTYNKANVSTLLQPAAAAAAAQATAAAAATAASTHTQEGGVGGVGTNIPILPTTQKVYNKFLKEYSNKLLTQGNNSNNTSHSNNDSNISHSNPNTLKHSNNASNTYSFINNGTPKPFIASPSANTKQTQQQHNHYLQQQQQQQQQPHTNNNIINNSLPGVAAIAATLNNQLKFDSCQVATPPPPILAPTTITPSNSNISILDKSSFSNSCNSQITNDNCKTDTNSTTNEMSSAVATGPSGDKPFEYVTLTGNVIRSVVPPGKGNVNYKVNQGGYARPYGAPKSPVTYPPQPQQQWNQQPPPTQPKPVVGGNAYATLPRSNVGQQGRRAQSMYNNYRSNYTTSTQYNKNCPSVVGSNRYSTMPSSLNTTSYNNYSNISYNNSNNYNQEEANEESLQPQYAECYFQEGYEFEESSRQQRANFCWPPAENDGHRPPTAAPLYIPPPETQHVVAKPLENPPPPLPDNRTDCVKHPCSGESEQYHQQQQQQQEQQQQLQQQIQQQQQCQWQSRSAPQLTVGMTQHQLECESGSDSYTTTSTTTTTTSEEYQRMYAAQVQAYQTQQTYEQSGSEFDYHMDMEVAAMQQQQDHLQLSSSQYTESGRRSAQECIETLVPPLSTYRLVDMVREVTPSPVPEPPQSSRHVVFLEDPEIKQVDSYEEYNQREEQGKKEADEIQEHTTETLEASSFEEETEDKGFIRDDRSHILESERIFQPTPEIKIEIAPVKQIPPTKIPNPCPKEWINPMVRILTTAPETPFHMVDCLCPRPCECSCQVDCVAEVAQEITQDPPKEPKVEPSERPPSPVPIPEPVHINAIWDVPTISKAMTIAPEFELKFAPPASEGIPLPEETEPYMPPPIVVKPYLREDYRPKTPLLRALTTAPDKPFEGHFERDVPIHILDLPTPKEHLSMKDALRTAPERPYTPLNPENATHMFEEQRNEEEKKKMEFQVLDKEEELGLSKGALQQVEYYTTEKRKSSTTAFAAMQAFQSSSQPLSSSTTPRQSISYTKAENDLDIKKYYDAHERYQKRRNYFSQKEQELLQQQQTDTTSHVQEKHYQQQHQQRQEQTNTRDESSLYSLTKASSSSSNSSSAVQHQQQQQQQTTSSTYASNLTQATKSSQSMAYASAGSATTSAKLDVHEIIEEVTDELEHSEVLFPPPSPLSHLKQRPSSGLHRPESIPKYQRNWTVLPTQSPIRTPEPPELRENVPLAFVDTPKALSAHNGANGNAVHKPVAQMSARTVSQQQTQAHQQQTTASAYNSSSMRSRTEQRQQQQLSSTVTSSSSATTASDSAKQQLQLTKPTIPIIVEDRSGPVSMAFQALDEHMVRDQSQTPSRPYTPSMINKPAPITPYYQTAEKLCFDECPATHARDYDRRSASPFPDRAKSPAPGPPPNPLAAIRAPRLKETEVPALNSRIIQAGSITTGQSYLGAQQAQQQERLLSHNVTGTQSAMQSYSEQPEKREVRQIGNMTMERRENASRLEEQKQRQMQSHTTTQVGNTQIERRRKVTEEFEHTSSAKTVEIRTGSQSSTERRQSYGKTGFVVNQAKRLSGLEEEISNLTSQSQAITARAASLSDTKFPELHNQSAPSTFPSKPVLPSHDEPQSQSYYISGSATKKLSEPPSSVFPPAQYKPTSTICGTSMGYSQQSLSQQQQQQQKSLTTLSTTSCSHHQQQQQQQLLANTVSSSLTKASATTCTNNQAYQSITAGSNHNATSTSTATSSTAVCPVTGTYCRPGHTCCKQQIYDQKNNNGTRPTASLGTAGYKPPQATNITAYTQPQSALAPAPAAAAAAAAAATVPTASKTPNVTAPSDNNNNNTNDSTTGGMAPKGGAYSATSAPKRGRGILNRAVSPGVRVPLCNSCGTNIRGPFITALGKIWCPDHFHCVNGNCRRPLQDIGFVEEKGDLYCEYCFEKYLAPTCSKCSGKIKGDCLNAIGKHFHPECFACGHCGKLFGNTPFFLEDGMPYCEADWNELFTTKCFACGFPVEAGDRWVEALNHNYHSQCFNCTYCKQNLEGQSFYNKGGRPFCKNHAR